MRPTTQPHAGLTSRRQFLARSMTTAAVAGPALALARGAHAAGSDVIRIGMIGCGGRCTGAAAAALTADPAVRLVAMTDLFADRVQTKRKALKAQKPDQVLVDDAHCFSGIDGYKHVIEAADIVLIACAAKFHPLYVKAAIAAGKPFVGIHTGTDTFRSAGVDPYIAMIGAEFLTHDAQQEATMKVVSPDFPGMQGLGKEFAVHDEWYSMCKFANDLHVILLQETAGMKGRAYRRPPSPATWARMQGKGRVFSTSMGHDNIWKKDIFRQVLLGGIAWALGNAEADVTPNIAVVAPGANQLPK